MALTRSLKKIACFVWLGVLVSCGAVDTETKLSVVPVGPTDLRLGESLELQATAPVALWSVLGEPETGTIDPFGVYRAPELMPNDPQITVLARRGEETFYVWIRLVE